MLRFVYFSVECLFNKFDGINCRPKLGAKLLNLFFHGWRQVNPAVKNAMHRFFNGSQHFLYCNITVGSRHGTAAFFQQISRYHPCSNWWNVRASIQPPRQSDTHHLHCDGRRTSELLGGQHHVDSLLLQKDHDELRWLRCTRIATDRMHIVGSFIESLPWHESDFLATPHLHDNRSLQDVDECVCIMTMDGVHRPRRIIDGDHQHLLPRSEERRV